MTISTNNPILGPYIEWLDSHMQSYTLPNSWTELTLPFLDRYGDYISLYVKKDDEIVELTDAGATLTNLRSSGWDISTPQREDLVDEILQQFGLTKSNGTLSKQSTLSNLPESLHMFIQAILSMNNLVFTSQHRVAALFTEDVGTWIRSLDTPYRSDLQVQGSTLSHHVDFVLDSQNSTPSRAVKTFEALNRRAVESIAFSRMDTRDDLPEWIWIALVNDSERRPSSQNIQALHRNQIRYIPWSKHEESLYTKMLRSHH